MANNAFTFDTYDGQGTYGMHFVAPGVAFENGDIVYINASDGKPTLLINTVSAVVNKYMVAEPIAATDTFGVLYPLNDKDYVTGFGVVKTSTKVGSAAATVAEMVVGAQVPIHKDAATTNSVTNGKQLVQVAGDNEQVEIVAILDTPESYEFTTSSKDAEQVTTAVTYTVKRVVFKPLTA